MIRYRTVKQDIEILLLLIRGVEPKIIWRTLRLTSVSVVYNAQRRYKRKPEFYTEQMSKIEQRKDDPNITSSR